MFESIEMAPADPILGLSEAFQQDQRSTKINLSVGVFKDEAGVTPILKCVKQAEARLLDDEPTKSYLGIGGLPGFNREARSLLFGAQHAAVTTGRAISIQTPGGTGALRVAGDFLHRCLPDAAIWYSKPTWANHTQIFPASNVPTYTYAYLDDGARSLDFDAMMTDIQKIPEGNVVLLHGCCHNPSGVDPNKDQWNELATCLAQRKLIPLIDFAYQGFGAGLEEDAAGLRIVAEHCPEMLICSSFSKNFGLYRERVGALTVVAASQAAAESVVSHLKKCSRVNFSNPPAHGAAIVETILTDADLQSQWEVELQAMRERIDQMRSLFVETMKQHAPDHDFSFLLSQNGMFSFSGLTEQQVDRLREEYAVYIVRSGRINVAGITPANVQRLCESIAAVL